MVESSLLVEWSIIQMAFEHQAISSFCYSYLVLVTLEMRAKLLKVISLKLSQKERDTIQMPVAMALGI